MSVINYKCKSCGANLFFSPQKQKWICNYCKNEFTLEEMNGFYGIENLDKFSDSYTECVCYTCKNCGAEIITNKNTSATICVYCDSPSVIKDRIKGEFKPDKIIPFKVSKNEAIKLYRKYRKSFFLADSNNTESILEKIKPIYVPSYLFDLSVNAEVEYLMLKQDYSESREYEKMRKKVKARFKDIPVDASLVFPNKFMNSIEPFNYKEMVEFSPKYLSGFYADKYDVVDYAVKNEVENRVKNTVKDYMKKKFYNAPYYISAKIRDNTKVEISNIQTKYVLLPVWLLNISHKNKIQHIIVNGQTGKVVSNIPISKLKSILLYLVIFLLITVPSLIVLDIDEGIENHILFAIISVVLGTIISKLLVDSLLKIKHFDINKRKTAGEYADSSSIEVIDIKDESSNI